MPVIYSELNDNGQAVCYFSSLFLTLFSKFNFPHIICLIFIYQKLKDQESAGSTAKNSAQGSGQGRMKSSSSCSKTVVEDDDEDPFADEKGTPLRRESEGKRSSSGSGSGSDRDDQSADSKRDRYSSNSGSSGEKDSGSSK